MTGTPAARGARQQAGGLVQRRGDAGERQAAGGVFALGIDDEHDAFRKARGRRLGAASEFGERQRCGRGGQGAGQGEEEECSHDASSIPRGRAPR